MGLFTRPEMTVLMVCTANICRSPMAEGLLRAELVRLGWQRRIRVDSAGTHATQPGRAADPRAKKILRREGVDIRKCRARQVREPDFARFDHILAMDNQNYRWLQKACPESLQHRISRIGEWGRDSDPADIPDPYYGNIQGFEQVLGLLRTSIGGFLTYIDL